jgi:hypothetical protein
MEAKVCNYTHLVYTITHLRCVRLHTIGCVKLYTFVLHTLYLLGYRCVILHTFYAKTHLCWLHTFPPYTPFTLLHTFWIYTPFSILHSFWIYTPFYATHLLNIHTFPNFTHLLNIHTFLFYTPMRIRTAEKRCQLHKMCAVRRMQLCLIPIKLIGKAVINLVLFAVGIWKLACGV